MARSHLDYHVLDAIINDCDLYEDMMHFLNESEFSWHAEYGRTLQPVEVQVALLRLVQEGLVEVSLIDPVENDIVECGERVWPADKQLSEMFFDLTGRGRVLYLNWDV
jgi:hypothetical protein